MTLRQLLDLRSVDYQWQTHDSTFTSQELAHSVHRSGHAVVKPVVMDVDGELMLCAIPACRRVNPKEVRDLLHARDVHLADEETLKRVFGGCELGAEPPIGRLFGLRTILDETLGDKPVLTFQAGTHRDAVSMSLRDFVSLADPVVGHITFGEV